MTRTSGIHHITAITADPQKNVDFYEGFLGQRLVKRTVNFDDPRSYHLYFGDAPGSPGTLVTFFYWSGIPKGTHGAGELSHIAYGIGVSARDFWVKRAKDFNIACSEHENELGESVLRLSDPDGIAIELVLDTETAHVAWWESGGIPKEHMLRGFCGATLTVPCAEAMVPVLQALGYEKSEQEGERSRFVATGEFARRLDILEAPDLPFARQGSGSVHHIAVRAATDADELELRSQVIRAGLQPTTVIERNYFRSVYFQTPGGVLFEIATDEPGFAIDESVETLGEKLVLPAQYEPYRSEIESALVPITLPRTHHGLH